MPTLDAYPYDASASVLVQADWADTPAAQCVQVRRVLDSDGSTEALRPYVWWCGTSGMYLHLSGGVGIFWDTEVPLDVPFHYEMDATDALGAILTSAVVTPSMTINSGGEFFLRDPVRPCNDRRVLLCFDPRVECEPGEGIFFAEMQQEGYAANSTAFLPTNAQLPIPVARQRRAVASTLLLVTRTFEDRDAVLALNDPGSPLLFSVPPGYGIPDRYMTVGDVTVSRGLPDHRFEPRMISMPHQRVARPVGPSQGVCGARFEDLCDVYATWTLAAASGASYASLITGAPAALGWETWAEINTDYVSWAAVLASQGTWANVLASP